MTVPRKMRDIFRVPSWRWHRHRNLSAPGPAILFSISYSPLAEALGLYREVEGQPVNA